ncbi:MAG TPA: hypothetical protein VGD67_07355 [Pseudonocardiaceae bacterium]
MASVLARPGTPPGGQPPAPPGTPSGGLPAAVPGAPGTPTGGTPARPAPPESAAERTTNLPPVPGGAQPHPAEVTTPLPPVRQPQQPAQQPPQQSQPDHLTTALPGPRTPDALPLLDLLAPQEPPQADPYAGQLLSGPYQAQYGQAQYGQGPYPEQAQYTPAQQGPAGYGHGPYDQTPHGAAQYPRQLPRPRRNPLAAAAGGTSRGTRVVLGVGAGVVLLLVLGLVALNLSGSGGGGRTADGDGTSGAGPTSTTTSAVRVADGYQFTQSAARTDANCAANAYGKVAEFFTATPCGKLDRALYISAVDGRPTVVAVSVVTMPDEKSATDLRTLVDTSGTGNINDLLRAGVTVPGGPAQLSDAGYASTRVGSTVVIAEADFADPATKDADALDGLSRAALQLRN